MDDQRTDRESGGVSEPPKRFRFSLKTLLIVMALVAMYAMGYAAGHHDGEVKMMKSWLEKTTGKSAE